MVAFLHHTRIIPATLREAPDALIAALGGYIEARRTIPAPSKTKRGQAMQTAQITNVELGRRLGISEGAVRRLLDLDHRSHIGQVEAALAALGHRLVVAIDAVRASPLIIRPFGPKYITLTLVVSCRLHLSLQSNIRYISRDNLCIFSMDQ